MADFKTIVSRMEDNDKTAIFLNSIKGFKANKNADELTLLTEKGWGQKVALGRAVTLLLVIDRDEFERLDSNLPR